ncbi:MAG TPA: hypothetical protein VF194_03900 [Ferrovibrio sp.]|jgi:hypothetical protein|uniref:hypothetical protein n=1 Tax=Ferrovibrio sp. TaxID=1917215 RepID=UPI002ED21C86
MPCATASAGECGSSFGATADADPRPVLRGPASRPAEAEGAAPRGIPAAELAAAKAPLDPEVAAIAVFDVMAAHLDPGETVKVLGLLPAELRDLL